MILAPSRSIHVRPRPSTSHLRSRFLSRPGQANIPDTFSAKRHKNEIDVICWYSKETEWLGLQGFERRRNPSVCEKITKMGEFAQGIPGFAHAAGLVHAERGTSFLQARRPGLRYVRHQRNTRVTGPKLCVERTDGEKKVQHGLTISRNEVLQRTRSGRALKLRRWARLSEIDVQGEKDARVDVWMVINRDRQDFRVRGKVESELLRVCDRCAKEYSAKTDGRFDVVLRTGDAESEEDEAELVEALEEFGASVGEIWMGDHVRDGVYLGFPTKSLCSESCKGVDLATKAENGSVRYNTVGKATEENDVGRLGTRETGELLMKLKQRLEKEGL